MIKTNRELVAAALNVAQNFKTLYVMGCFGAPMTEANKRRYKMNNSYNRQPERQLMIQAADDKTFGFDCVCFIKGLLWGWYGDPALTYGGARYKANGVPDIDADQMISVCKDVSKDFSKIEIGEAVWMSGHIGIYVGNGYAVECTPAWANCVQITACNCDRPGYNRRNWVKHGKLPYIAYEAEKTWDEIHAWSKKARDWAVKEGLIAGYGNGDFGWDDPVTREQLAVILYKMNGGK